MAEEFWQAWIAFSVHKIRSTLTTLGIFIGVVTIIIIFTLIQSINRYVEKEVSAISAGTLYVNKFPWIITDDFFEYRNRPPVTLRDYKALNKKLIQPCWMTPVMHSRRNVAYRKNLLEDVSIIGCNENYPEVNHFVFNTGRWFSRLEVRDARAVCVLGAGIRERFFPQEDPLQRRLKIGGYSYRVIGVLEKEGRFLGSEIENCIMLPFSALHGFVYDWQGIAIAIKPFHHSELENVKQEVRGILRAWRRIPLTEADNFSINQQDMLMAFYHKVTGTAYWIVFMVGAVSLLVGGVGIMNIMLVSVTERTKEIGILKALGATRKNILRQFLLELLIICSIGGSLGIGAGILLTKFLLMLFNLEIAISVWTVVIGYGFSITIGIISGMYPAHRAAKLSPVEALRYE